MIDINFIWEIGTIVFNVFAKIYNSLINGFILIRHDSEDADNLDFKYKIIRSEKFEFNDNSQEAFNIALNQAEQWVEEIKSCIEKKH